MHVRSCLLARTHVWTSCALQREKEAQLKEKEALQAEATHCYSLNLFISNRRLFLGEAVGWPC